MQMYYSAGKHVLLNEDGKVLIISENKLVVLNYIKQITDKVKKN